MSKHGRKFTLPGPASYGKAPSLIAGQRPVSF